MEENIRGRHMSGDGKYLEEQMRLHGGMTPQDVMKWLYQASFGAEHLIRDARAAGRYLREEYERTPIRPEPLYERISEGYVRMNLGAWKGEGLPEEWLLNLFLETAANPPKDGRERFQRGLREITDYFVRLEDQKKAGDAGMDGPAFGRAEWEAFLRQYPVNAPVAVHHGERYRAQENPAYRLVCHRFLRILPVLRALAPLCRDGRQTIVVAIDGRSASGKTTMAQQLASVTGAGVIHVDDFFLPPELRTGERFSQPGGNVHYERFQEEVLPWLKRGEAFSYQAFDCSRMTLGERKQVPAGGLRIVEGAYALHPLFGDYADFRVFSDVAQEEQVRRILARNGEKAYGRFRDEWIPLEETYFRIYGIREKADVIL